MGTKDDQLLDALTNGTPVVKQLWGIVKHLADGTVVKQRVEAVLISTQLVTDTLDTVLSLRTDLDYVLTQSNKDYIDRSLVPAARNALDNVARLVEAVRVDLAANYGVVRASTKFMFLQFKSSQVVECLGLLTLASQNLNTAVILLHSQRDAARPNLPLRTNSTSNNSEARMFPQRTGVPSRPRLMSYSGTQLLRERRSLSYNSAGSARARSGEDSGDDAASSLTSISSPEIEHAPQSKALPMDYGMPRVYTGSEPFIVLEDLEDVADAEGESFVGLTDLSNFAPPLERVASDPAPAPPPTARSPPLSISDRAPPLLADHPLYRQRAVSEASIASVRSTASRGRESFMRRARLE